MKENFVVKYYCPVEVHLSYRDIWDDEDCVPADDERITKLFPEIKKFVENNDGGSMIDYIDRRLAQNLIGIYWSVEMFKNKIYGCITATFIQPLTADEEKMLKGWIEGQNSDGFGESLEQKALRTEDGEIYISFWQNDKNYFIYNEKEFSYYLTGKQPYTFLHATNEDCEKMWRCARKFSAAIIARLEYNFVGIGLAFKSNSKCNSKANVNEFPTPFLVIYKLSKKDNWDWSSGKHIDSDIQQKLTSMTSWEDIKKYMYNILIQYCRSNNIDHSKFFIEENVESTNTKITTKKRCPKCGTETFTVTAHVCQEWKVDCNGTFIEAVEECSQVLHQPDDDDIWTCANCGFDAAGSEFNVQKAQIPAPSRKRLLKIFGCTMTAYSFELEEYLVEANERRLDKKIDEIIMKDFKMSESEMKSLHSLSGERMIELIKKFIPAYELILREQDYDSEEDLHKVVLNEFGMTEEEYDFFTKK